MNYQELLLSEHWIKKRKEILERDKNSCHRCGYLANIFKLTQQPINQDS